MKINYIAPINTLGYGIVGSNLLKEFDKQNVEICLWPIGPVEGDEETLRLSKWAYDKRHYYDAGAPSLKVWHQDNMAQQVSKTQWNGFPIFESDKFKKEEVAEIERMDQIFVCSEWAREVVINNCDNDHVLVAPLGVDRNIFHENVGEADDNWTTFLTVGKWEYRKGHDIIVEAFNKAFDLNDRVRLWMMTSNPFLTPAQTWDWELKYKSSKLASRINFLPRVKSNVEVAEIMAAADCGVFPARAEGWNLELLEMMSMGKQVITTNYSAHTEFCDNVNAYLIDIDKKERVHDGIFFGDDSVGEWAALGESQIDQLVKHMRDVHANDNSPTNQAGIETAKTYSWKNSADIILDHMLLAGETHV